jgi:hypothetical protein
MKNQRSFALGVFLAFTLLSLQTAALAQMANDGKLANVNANGSSVRWEVLAANSGLTLTVAAPDGRVFRKEFGAGASPEFTLIDKQGERLPDGQYTYELRLDPVISPGVREKLKATRARDDESESERTARKLAATPGLVQSGSFAILNGTPIVAGSVEDSRRSAKVTELRQSPRVISGNTVNRLLNHRISLGAVPDDVIPDDLIVQGSACVGFDCVDGEVFGFDTIRVKENNTRIQFDDTSTSAGFPTNNWQIRANNSASGGASFLAFVDQGASGNSETGTILFEVDAGAPANSLKISSTGKIGLRTATPVLDVHMNTSDTPAIRFEQNNGGGFTAQTWDVAGNEANFFVRDVTGGSRLPFRVRPGAPTSSIDISATGNVGVGTASPAFPLDVTNSSASVARFKSTAAANAVNVTLDSSATRNANIEYQQAGTNKWFEGNVASNDRFRLANSNANGNAELFTVLQNGNVGIGTATPDLKLSVNGDADKSLGGGSWQFFSDERLKNIKGRFNSGLKAVMQLQPIRYEYKRDNALGLQSEVEQVGFGAQALQKIIPEAVSKNANGYLMVNNDPILWTMLNAIKEQQKEIAQLRGEIRKLRAASRRHRK